LDLIH